MLKEMTISVEDDVYQTLSPVAAGKDLGEYISGLVRSQKEACSLEEGYRAMAADTGREEEASCSVLNK